MLKSVKALWLALAVIFFSGLIYAATEGSNALTWFSQSDTSITATFSPSTCMNSTGTQSLTVKVFKQPTGNADTNATVTAVVNEADGDTNNVTFSNQNDGNYTYTYTFDSNGTYKFQVHVDDSNQVNDTYDLNQYIYVKDFSIVISFLNNNASYNPGNTVTIRNRVLNSDGNAFNDINSSVSVFYPDSSALHSGETMTALGSGEYVFSFLAPSTLGTYSATSAFSCNNESDSNSLGRFTVAAADTGGSGNTGGTTTTTTTSGSGSSGGSGGSGGGGGGGTGTEGLKAATRGFAFDQLEIGVPATGSLLLSHGIPHNTNFLVQMQILRGDKLEFYSEESVPFLEPGKSFRVTFAEKWVPKAAGTYVVTITLASMDKMIKYDVQTLRFDIAGVPRYDLEAACLQNSVTAGLPYDFNISAYNLGDYYEDVTLSWWIEDAKAQKIGFSSTPLAVYPGTSISRAVSIFIPPTIERGTYTARVRLEFKDVVRDAFCSFTVQSPQVYYGEILSQLEEQIEKLDADLREKQSQGYVSDYLAGRVNDLKQRMAGMKERAANFDYSGLNTDISRTVSEINEITELNAGLARETALSLSGIAGLLQLLTGAILLIYTAHFLYHRLRRGGGSGRRTSFEQRLERLLGLGED